MKTKISFLLLMVVNFLLQSFTASAQIPNCGASVPTFNIDFSSAISDSTWISPFVARHGYCCSVCGGGGSNRCINFVITVGSQTTGILLSISAGSLPSGSLSYQIDCSNPIPLYDTACITSPGIYYLTFCKPGNNENIYNITSITSNAVTCINPSQDTSSSASSGWNPTIAAVSESFNAVQFVSNNIGFAVGSEPNLPPYNNSVIVKTTDAGISWDTVYSSSTDFLTGLVFPTPLRGYARPPTGGIIKKTINGGITWTNTSPVPSGNITALNFINNMTGFAGDNIGNVYKTTDGGNSWSSGVFVGAVSVLESFTFISSNTGLVVGHDTSIIAKTTDGGNNWNIITQNFNLKSIHAPSHKSIYSVGLNETILKSTDQGDSWTLQSVPCGVVTNFNSIFCPGNSVCYAVGTNGYILKTNNGGSSWQQQYSGTISNLNSVHSTNLNRSYAAGNHGTILKTTTGGNRMDISGSNSSSEDGFVFHPNPATSEVTLNFGKELRSNVQICNMLGEVLFQTTTSAEQIKIDVSAFPKGIYFVSVRDGENNLVVRKVVKM